MDLYDRLKRFFGFNKPHEFNDSNRYIPEHPQEETEDSFHHGLGRNFNIFTDPLEIHRYFEEQMSNMLKNFGFEEFGDGFTHHFNFPQIEELPQEEYEPPSGDIRDQFLKPGYKDAIRGGNEDKKDEDIDGRLDVRDWGSVFRGENSVTPFRRQIAPKSHVFGQSVTSKTVQNPDGSIEIHRTVKDNQGNEETTITRKIADKEYTITKRRDKDGKEEIIENFLNIDEKDVDKYFPKKSQSIPEIEQQRWRLFDKFFK